MKKFFYPSSHDYKVSFALLLMRLVAGTAFMFHGWPKIQHAFSWMPPEAPVPGFLQALAAFSEFVGGLAWVLGLLTPLASLGILSTMTVAVNFHLSRGDGFVGHGVSYEPALVYLCLSILFVLAGAGKFSLDAVLFGKAKDRQS